MPTISVLICTRNRSNLLRRCLISLSNQTPKPYEVIIVDNGSRDNTKEICDSFAGKMSLQYVFENHVGLPYARNAGIRLASGDVYAFIDDDCVAKRNWIRSITDHFSVNQKSVGIIGKIFNATPDNIYSAVEHAYYQRWLGQNVENPMQPGKILSGQVVDFKNAVFRSSFIRRFKFSNRVPYGDVGDEDIEIGLRLYQANDSIYFDPSVVVYHRYSQSLNRLIVRNFWNGYANQELRLYLSGSYSLKQPKKVSLNFTTDARQINKLLFALLLFSYPVFSTTGKIYSVLLNLLHVSGRIPIRFHE